MGNVVTKKELITLAQAHNILHRLGVEGGEVAANVADELGKIGTEVNYDGERVGNRQGKNNEDRTATTGEVGLRGVGGDRPHVESC